jgi:hypothetical protein
MINTFFSGTTGFGWVELNGVTYSGDFIIHVDGSISKRRKELSKKLPPINYHTPLGVEELVLLSDENRMSYLLLPVKGDRYLSLKKQKNF